MSNFVIWKMFLCGASGSIIKTCKWLLDCEVGSVCGNVKWFNNEKGYGFIDYADNEDIFVHYSAIRQDGYKTLSEGQRVEFDLIETPKGLQAVNVRPAACEKVM